MTRLLIGELLLLPPAVATGETFVVNSTLDAVDATPGDGVCAAAGGACTLRAAVDEANALTGGHAITLPAGTYTLTIAGLSLGPDNNITINGSGQATTIVDANGQHGAFGVAGASLTLNGITVQHGYASRGAGISVVGVAGVLPLDYRGVLTLNDTTITQNVSTGGGGGVYLAMDGSAAMNRTTVSGNSAASGGGIYYSAGTCIFGSSLALTDSTIAQNVATGSGGGFQLVQWFAERNHQPVHDLRQLGH